MNPQPPVTRMRMAARTSSAEGDAPAEYSSAAGVRDQLEMWKARLAQTSWTPWLILGLAAFLRLFLLGIKPPHFDEGINGWFVDQVIHNGFYRYDPTNYHGPLHFYVLLLSESLLGRNLWALRLPVVLVSIGCVWLTLKFEPLVGRNVSRIAALAMAVSPGFEGQPNATNAHQNNRQPQRPEIPAEQTFRQQQDVKVQGPVVIRRIVSVKAVMYDLIHKPAIDAFIEMRRLDTQQKKTQERSQPQD